MDLNDLQPDVENSPARNQGEFFNRAKSPYAGADKSRFAGQAVFRQKVIQINIYEFFFFIPDRVLTACVICSCSAFEISFHNSIVILEPIRCPAAKRAAAFFQ